MGTESGQNPAPRPGRRGRPPGQRKISQAQAAIPLKIARRGRPPKNKQESYPASSRLVKEFAPSYETSFPGDANLSIEEKAKQSTPFSIYLQQLVKGDHFQVTRLAQELDVVENTVNRWLNGSAVPRAIHCKKLLDAFPEHRNALTDCINRSFPGLLESLTSTDGREIQKELYTRIIGVVANVVDDETRFWQTFQLIIDHALLHLDVTGQGLSIQYAGLMPAYEDGIHSLYEVHTYQNVVSQAPFEHHAYFGITSFVGRAAVLQRTQTCDDLNALDRSQVEFEAYEKSACAHPVMRAGRIAGVLQISSTQIDFFHDSAIQQAVIEYAQLLALALRQEDFQPFSALKLRAMPDLRWQRTELNSIYRERVISYARLQGVSRQEAEVMVRRDLEAEFEEIGRIQLEQRLALKHAGDDGRTDHIEK